MQEKKRQGKLIARVEGRKAFSEFTLTGGG